MIRYSFLAPALIFCLTSSLGAAPATGELAAKIQPFVDNQTIPGAVMLVASKDKILDVETIGYADLATKRPMQPHDFFWIASMSKAMTTTCLMMLVDEGKVNVDDPVEKYLPEFHNMMVGDPKDPSHWQPANHPITVKEIMSHSAGLNKHSPEEDKLHCLDKQPLAVAVKQYAKMPLLFQPSSSYSYSNAGINTAGRIIEVVSGMPYEDFMQKRLFDPLGMKDTTFWPTAEELQRLATSYIQTKEPGFRVTPLLQLHTPLDQKEGRYPMPAGGLFSTAQDVAKFLQMYMNDGMVDGKRILSSKSIKMLTSKEAPHRDYGFGWSIKPYGFAHGGAEQTYMGVDTKAGVGSVLMTQVAGPFIRPDTSKLSSVFAAAAATLGNGGGAQAAAPARTEGQ
jgi:CubicO group peptidase (beta-lactamase class C family)